MEPVKDFVVTVRVRNNRILRAIKRANYTSLKAFCQDHALSYVTISGIVTMRISPLGRDDWSQTAFSLSSALHCEPEDLWPAHIKRLSLKKSREYLMNVDDIQGIGHIPKHIDMKTYGKLLSVLSARQRDVVESHFSGETLREIGQRTGVEGETIRVIESKAFRRMRRKASLMHAEMPIEGE